MPLLLLLDNKQIRRPIEHLAGSPLSNAQVRRLFYGTQGRLSAIFIRLTFL